MQHPEPDDGTWPASVLRNRRLNQTPDTENPATRLRFMHQRRFEVECGGGLESPSTASAERATADFDLGCTIS